MTNKDAFDDADWQHIRNSPWVVALAVIASDPSGAVDTGREIDALRHLVAETDAHGSPNDLIRAVAHEVTADRSSGEPSPVGSLEGYDGIREGAIEYCRAVVEILDGVADPDEGRQFRVWLLELAQGVAESVKKGGFLGFGGAQVSDAEQAALDDLAVALGV